MNGRRPLGTRIFTPRLVFDAARAFVQIEASSGIVLFLAAVAALVWVNSPWGDFYSELWHSHIALDTDVLSIDSTLGHAVNDGLMTLFFFVVGLEIKRELVHGELSSPRRALLPAIAALGGMVVPALIFLAWNAGGEGARGWGIPMATDIAFALGVLSLLGRRIPFSVKVFLLALAIADDIGAIVVIAVFYTSTLDLLALGLAAAVLCVTFAINRSGVRNVDVYVFLGVCLWLAAFESGVHATLTGVALGLLTPASPFYHPATLLPNAERLLARYSEAVAAGDVDDQQGILGQIEDLAHGTESPLDRLERNLHPWVSYLIVPLFALANAGVAIDADSVRAAAESPVTLGVALGLLIGKPLGVFLFTWLAVRLRLGVLPEGASWLHILGVGILAGIGFTVSLLITALAFDDPARVDAAKLGILGASVLAGVLGYTLLHVNGRSFVAGGTDRAETQESTA